MAGEEETTAAAASTTTGTTINPSFPTARVKKIVKIDTDITRVSSEALHLISGASELFLGFLAEKSFEIAAEKKRKIIKLDHLRLAVKRHQPTRDFLLDSLPPAAAAAASQPSVRPPVERTVKEKPAPPHTRRIDSFFKKPASKVGSDRIVDVDDVIPDGVEDVDDVISDGAEDVDDVAPVVVEDVDDVAPDVVEDVDDAAQDRVEDVDDVILVDEDEA